LSFEEDGLFLDFLTPALLVLPFYFLAEVNVVFLDRPLSEALSLSLF